MSEPIKPGDLVVQVRVCCDQEARRYKMLGVPWQATGLYNTVAHCRFCGFGGEMVKVAPQFIFIGWLTKIPPLWELDEQPREEEISA